MVPLQPIGQQQSTFEVEVTYHVLVAPPADTVPAGFGADEGGASTIESDLADIQERGLVLFPRGTGPTAKRLKLPTPKPRPPDFSSPVFIGSLTSAAGCIGKKAERTATTKTATTATRYRAGSQCSLRRRNSESFCVSTFATATSLPPSLHWKRRRLVRSSS
jgi:hypothetical protein